MRMILFAVLLIGCTLGSVGCFSAASLSDFQTADTLPSDSSRVSVGVALAQWCAVNVDTALGVMNVTFTDRTVFPVLFAQGQTSLLSNIDVGGDVSTTIGSLNLKAFVKLGLPVKPLGVSIGILPSVGAGFGEEQDSTSTVKLATVTSSHHLLASVALPCTYRFHEASSVTVTPFLFTQSIAASFQTLHGNVALRNNGYGISSQGCSVMLESGGLRCQVTLANVKNDHWIATGGVSFLLNGN